MAPSILRRTFVVLALISLLPLSAGAQIKDTRALVEAINNGEAGATVVLAPGTFEITAPLRPRKGMKISGAGVGKTIIRNTASWAPGNAGLSKDEGATRSAIVCDKYLFDLGENTTDVEISNLTMTGPQVHGAICGVTPHGLHLHHLEFKSFLWAGLRTFIMDRASIHDNSFFDAGNKSNVTTGSSGGGLFLTYTKDSEIRDNRFTRSKGNDYYGIKGREGRQVHIHWNTIDTNFAIEFPFDNDHEVEIDHNFLGGAVSIPKHSGGSFPDGKYSFHVHHNYLNTSYSFEFQRNGLEINHNLFDIPTSGDGGNLISGFDSAPAPGGTKMHNNLIRNPGRGLYWSEGVYNNFAFTNNHVRGATTVTPRTEGLFDFRPSRNGATTDWRTIVIRDNVFELEGTARPLMRNTESRMAVVENNRFTNISDAASFANRDTGKTKGPLEPLKFKLGAEGEWSVDQWTLAKTPVDSQPAMGGAGGSAAMGGAGGGQSAGAGSQGGGGTGGGSVAAPVAGSGAEEDNDDDKSNGDDESTEAGNGCSMAPHSRTGSIVWFLFAVWALMLRPARRLTNRQPRR